MQRMDCRFETLIFFDFETTGLFPRGYFAPPQVKFSSDPTVLEDELQRLIFMNYGVPKITEYSFMAVSNNDFQLAVSTMKENFAKASENGSIRTELASIIHSSIVKPSLTDAQWTEYENKRFRQPDIFVHSKEKLLEKNDFSADWKELKEFLENLPKPACFVAHNGVGFDYRILFNELEKMGVDGTESNIPEGILFVDSLFAFQKIENDKKNASENAVTPALVRRAAANSSNSLQQSLSSIGGVRKRQRSTRGPSFSLKVLYENIVKGNDTKFHHAQGDTEALVQISLAYGEDFLKYINSAAAELPF